MEKLDPGKSTAFAFIPKKLEIPNKPVLSVFPHNILFVSLANINGVDMSGKALYLPDLATFEEDDRLRFMRYFNQYWQDNSVGLPPSNYKDRDYIEIWNFKESGWYEAEKYIAGQHFSKSVGKDWKSFFIHLTGVGLAKGERCEFEPLENKQ